jgi:hypothetical protein
MWSISLLSWGGLIGAGYWWIVTHPNTVGGSPKPITTTLGCSTAGSKKGMASFAAMRNLPVNYWIGDSDLDWGSSAMGAQRVSFQSHYTTCAVKAGERVIESELAPRPRVDVAAGHTAYPLLLPQPPERMELNAGSRVDLWHEGRLLVREGAVLGVQCDPAGCVAILDLLTDELVAVQSTDPKLLRFVSRKPTKP